MNYRLLFTLPLYLYGALLALDWALLHLLPHHYVFNVADLRQIVNESLISNDIDASSAVLMDSVYAGLKSKYGDYIAEVKTDDWVFNNAGNAMGSMLILHASLTEYLIFFGTAIGTEGHTGTHFADDYFTIIHGKELAARPNATTPEVYLPGDVHHLPYGVNKQYAMPGDSWALELAQGYIPTMLPFGMIQVLTSTFDVSTFAKTVKLTAKHMIGNILRGKL